MCLVCEKDDYLWYVLYVYQLGMDLFAEVKSVGLLVSAFVKTQKSALIV